jgi:hypothetical protein
MWTDIVDKGVEEGKLFDEILDDVRKEMGFFHTPKRQEVYDYLMKNYEKDELFSNKFTIKKLLPDPFKDLENTQGILNQLNLAVKAIKDLQDLFRQMQSGNITGDAAEKRFEMIEQGIEKGYHAIFNLTNAIQENFKFS